MKKLITLILGIAFVYSCSNSSDGNPTAVPFPPSNLTGTVVSATQINLSWTDNSTNETGFKIERKTGTGTYAFLGSTANDINTFNDTGLSPGTNYTYRVYSYNTGGNSPTYSNELSVATTNTIVTDIDGNVYQLVNIDNQVWTKSNLNVSHYRNGDVIPQVTDINGLNGIGPSTGAWCYYAFTNSNGITYGKLYNFNAVNDPRGLAPVGYHIPELTELSPLINHLGGQSGAGGKMKQIGTINWQSPNTDATDESGFTGLPGGYFNIYPGGAFFMSIGYEGHWWTKTLVSQPYQFYLNFNTSNFSTSQGQLNMTNFLSVRCIKD